MPQIKMPDGVVVAFPDDMPPEQIKALILKKFPDADAAAAAAGPPAGFKPGTKEYADWAVKAARADQKLPQVSAPPPEATGPQRSLPQAVMDNGAAGFVSGVNAIPVAGPWLKDRAEEAKAAIHGVPVQTIQNEDQQLQQDNQTASTVGGVTGAVAPWLVGGAIPGVAKVLGMAGGPLLNAMGASALSSAAIGGADTLARGGSLGEAGQDAGIAGAIGGAIPGVGAAAKFGLKAIGPALDWTLGGVPSALKTAANTEKAAQKVVGRSMAADINANQALSQADDAAAAAAGQNVINLDRGGPATRRLARVASSQSPEAKAALEGATDRGVPGLDSAQFLTNLVGGSADDIALRDGLRKTARLVNAPAYTKAYSAPQAASIFPPQIQQLMQSGEFRDAVKAAERAASTDAALNGGKAVKSPFVFDEAGNWNLKTEVINPATGATITPATPSLQFWDVVQRELRKAGEKLGPTERTAKATYGQLREQLLGVLDNTVPEFKTARQGAAGFFGAEDALDAGRKFALQPRNLPEATKVFDAMSAPDKKAFAIGAASSVVDALKAGNESFAVVKKQFENPAAKEFWRMALGPTKATQLESYVKVQSIMDASKKAIQGGSQTYDLAVAGGLAGVGAGGSYFAPGNNVSNAAYFLAALRAGRGVLGRKLDQTVADKVADLLASGDKAALNKIIANATLSPQWRAALDAIDSGAGILSRSAGIGAAQQMAVSQ